MSAGCEMGAVGTLSVRPVCYQYMITDIIGGEIVPHIRPIGTFSARLIVSLFNNQKFLDMIFKCLLISILQMPTPAVGLFRSFSRQNGDFGAKW